MDKRGYNPKGVVLHNDAGGMNYKQYYNNLVNANYDRLARGIAHAYVDRTGIWEAIDESRIAWHVADGTRPGSGNHDFYGIEVNQSLRASDKEFLENEQAVFQFAAEKLKSGDYQQTEIPFVCIMNLVRQVVHTEVWCFILV